MVKVAVFGAGMAGLSAAHELRKVPDFEVDVYERSDHIGGKSSNQYGGSLPSGTDGREDLPGEHGFRFFPGFYRNIIRTMEEIPVTDPGNVRGRLVGSPDVGMARDDLAFLTFPRHAHIGRLSELLPRMLNMYEKLDFSPEDIYRMAWFNIKYMTSSEARRLEKYDDISWWDFVDAESPRYTDAYRQFQAAIPRTMSALVAQHSSALVVGDVTMQFLLLTPGGSTPDRLLDGPTDEAWLRPWQAYLTTAGDGLSAVNFHFKHELTGIQLAAGGGSVASMTVVNHEPEGGGGPVEETIVADHYLVAVPVERFVPLLTPEMRAADPQLQALFDSYNIDTWTGWMNGMQVGLKEDVPMVSGHAFYPSSAWALTSISQAQFWAHRGPVEDRFGDGNTRGVLSIIISDWKTAGDGYPPADQMPSREALKETAMSQLRFELSDTPEFDLDPANITYVHLDSGMQTTGPGGWSNETPLLLHPEKAYDARPDADSAISNLFLASDFIKTNVKLATMEGACEAARRAVGAINRAEGIPIEPDVWDLYEPETLEPFKLLDEAMMARGKDHIMDQFPLNLLLDAPGLMPFLPHILEFVEGLFPNGESPS